MRKNIAVFGIYPTRESVEESVAHLRDAGFRSTDVSVLFPENPGTKDLAHEKNTKAPEGATAGAGSGAVIGGALGWLAGIGSLVIPGLTAPLIAAGPIVASLAGVGAGGALGGIVGGLIGMGLPEYEAKRYAGRIRKGGILLSVHADDSEWVRTAREILEATGAEDVSAASEEKADFARSDRPMPRSAGGDTQTPSVRVRDRLVRDVMTARPETVHVDASLSEASDKMRSLNVGFLPVRSGDEIVGVLTDRDVTVRASARAHDPSRTTVKEAMTAEFAYCLDSQEVHEAARIMQEHRLRRLLVLDGAVDGKKDLVGVLSVDDIAARGDEKLAAEILKQAVVR